MKFRIPKLFASLIATALMCNSATAGQIVIEGNDSPFLQGETRTFTVVVDNTDDPTDELIAYLGNIQVFGGAFSLGPIEVVPPFTPATDPLGNLGGFIDASGNNPGNGPTGRFPIGTLELTRILGAPFNPSFNNQLSVDFESPGIGGFFRIGGSLPIESAFLQLSEVVPEPSSVVLMLSTLMFAGHRRKK